MSETVALRDGTTLEIRPLRPDDADGVRDAFERLSPESRYRRFLAATPRLTGAMLRYLTEVDHHDHEALLAVDVESSDGVGIARFVRDAGDRRRAEAAVTVADDWHGRGVGTILLDAIAARAREEGIARFTATVLAENDAVLDLLRHLGETTVESRENGTADVVVELPAEGPGEALRRLLSLTGRQLARMLPRSLD